jgi:hypothetical protein
MMTPAQLSALADRLYARFRLCRPARGLTAIEARAFGLWQRVARVRAAGLDRRVGQPTTAAERRARLGWARYVERERRVLTLGGEAWAGARTGTGTGAGEGAGEASGSPQITQ